MLWLQTALEGLARSTQDLDLYNPLHHLTLSLLSFVIIIAVHARDGIPIFNHSRAIFFHRK